MSYRKIPGIPVVTLVCNGEAECPRSIEMNQQPGETDLDVYRKLWKQAERDGWTATSEKHLCFPCTFHAAKEEA